MEEEIEDTPKQHYSDTEKQSIFNNEFMPHINSMYNFAYRLTLDSDDAKDLLQDTYLKAYRFFALLPVVINEAVF